VFFEYLVAPLYLKRSANEKALLAGAAALSVLNASAAHAYEYDPDLRTTVREYCSANFPITFFLSEMVFVAACVGVIILILWLCVRKRGGTYQP
jgi:hypothetical protein